MLPFFLIFQILFLEFLLFGLFRDYLKKHHDVCNQYIQLKNILSKKDWIDGNEYNNAKNVFMKQIESQALSWYGQQNI